MKKMYWRPSRVSKSAVFLIALYALISMFVVERLQLRVKQPHYEDKIMATKYALRAMETLRGRLMQKGGKIDRESDPTKSGLVGELMTPITSNNGVLEAKQTSINPNFAALIVSFLKRIKVKEGDSVAIGVSGSFPAINISVYSALKALNLNPIIISSASASQWGANRPEFSWLDMEHFLYRKKIFPFKSIAASMGGIEDRGMGMSEEGKNILIETARKYDLKFIDQSDFVANVRERMGLYEDYAADKPIKAFINVGGGTISVGRHEGKMLYRPGINWGLPFGASNVDSVMSRFSKRDIPVIHVMQINKLAEKYGLPILPQGMPIVGEGKIYYREEYNKLLTLGMLLSIIFILYAFIRSDIGYRIGLVVGKKKVGGRPEQMV